MGKSSNINGLFEGGSQRLTSLKRRSRERSRVLTFVLQSLPPDFAGTVAMAGIDQGRLTIGVVGAAWASRLRYVTEALGKRVSESMGVPVDSVRIKVVQPPASSAES